MSTLTPIPARMALLLTGIASFILMGAGQATLGPALPVYQAVLHLDTATAGWLISAFWIGCFLGVAGMYMIGPQITPRIALAAVILGSLLLAAAPGYLPAMLGVLIFGLGYGGVAAIFNPRILSAFGPRGPAMLSLVNAAFSVGATIAPLVFVWLGSDARIVFGIIGVLAAATLFTSGEAGRAKAVGETDKSGFRFHLPILGFGFRAIGMEACLGGLGPTAMIRAGIAPDRAAELLSAFFVAFLGGRLSLVFVANRVSSFAVYTGAVTFAAACAFGCALISPVWFFPPMGAATGLFFPGFYVTATRKMGDDARVGPVNLGTGLLGAIVSPLIYARVIEPLGDRGFFWLVAGVATTLSLLAMLNYRSMSR